MNRTIIHGCAWALLLCGCAGEAFTESLSDSTDEASAGQEGETESETGAPYSAPGYDSGGEDPLCQRCDTRDADGATTEAAADGGGQRDAVAPEDGCADCRVMPDAGDDGGGTGGSAGSASGGAGGAGGSVNESDAAAAGSGGTVNRPGCTHEGVDYEPGATICGGAGCQDYHFDGYSQRCCGDNRVLSCNSDGTWATELLCQFCAPAAGGPDCTPYPFETPICQPL